MRRLTVAEAAEALGITMDAVQMQISRGTLLSEEHEGRVYVLLDDAATHDRSGESEALISELKNRIRFLEEAAATRDEEIRRRDHIIAGLLERMPPAIEPPSQPPGSPPAPPPASPYREPVSRNPRPTSSPVRNLPVIVVLGLIVAMVILAVFFGAVLTS
jgi:hypothetical protein